MRKPSTKLQTRLAGAVGAALLALVLPLGAQAPLPQVALPASAANAPADIAPPDYQLGPGDVVALTVVGAPEFSRTVTIGVAGDVELTYLKAPVLASGKTASALSQSLETQFKAQNLLVDPQVAVAVVTAQSHPVTVGGSVMKPTVLYLTRPITTLDAILKAGGPDPKAAGAVVDISSGDHTQSIPYAEMASGKTSGANPQLQGGEHITVLPGGKVFVVGAVKDPGAFPITAATPLTALKAVALAKGWISVSSKPSKAVIMRTRLNGTVEHIHVNLNKIADMKAPDVPLQANDIIYVPNNRTMTLTVLAATSAFSTVTYAAALILSRH